MKTRLFLGILLLYLLGASGCETHTPVSAVGPNDEITVLTNTDPEGRVGDELRHLFEYPVEVVGKEDAFRLDFIPFHEFDIHRHVKNQVIAVDLSGNDKLANALPRMLESVAGNKLAAKEPFVLLLRDLWATGQSSLFVLAWSEEDLHQLLQDTDATALRRRYEKAVVTGLGKTMFLLGEERGITGQVAGQYGWTLRLTPGFYAAEDPNNNLVKFNADQPVRLLMVHWRDEELPIEEETWSPILSDILEVYNDGDFFLPERTEIREVQFQRKDAVKWEGVWQNEKYTIGGPFRAYAFNRGGKAFLVVGIVFAPGQDKVYLIRQVEALLSSFRLVT